MSIMVKPVPTCPAGNGGGAVIGVIVGSAFAGSSFCGGAVAGVTLTGNDFRGDAFGTTGLISDTSDAVIVGNCTDVVGTDVLVPCSSVVAVADDVFNLYKNAVLLFVPWGC